MGEKECFDNENGKWTKMPLYFSEMVEHSVVGILSIVVGCKAVLHDPNEDWTFDKSLGFG